MGPRQIMKYYNVTICKHESMESHQVMKCVIPSLFEDQNLCQKYETQYYFVILSLVFELKWVANFYSYTNYIL